MFNVFFININDDSVYVCISVDTAGRIIVVSLDHNTREKGRFPTPWSCGFRLSLVATEQGISGIF
jgi:hypothetical protein